jgi:hypothetical protein
MRGNVPNVSNLITVEFSDYLQPFIPIVDIQAISLPGRFTSRPPPGCISGNPGRSEKATRKENKKKGRKDKTATTEEVKRNDKEEVKKRK